MATSRNFVNQVAFSARPQFICVTAVSFKAEVLVAEDDK
jgi:hypothetical protein